MAKIGNSKAGAGSRGTSRGADGRTAPEFLSVPGMTDFADIPRDVYDKIVAAGGQIGQPRIEADGSLFIPVTGFSEQIPVYLSNSDLQKIRDAATRRR